MSDIIRLKRSGVTGAAPSSLELGELALNYADGALYYKTLAGSITTLGGADPRWQYLLPPAPTNVSATAGDAQATVSWTAPTSVAPITDYVVQYQPSGGSWTTFSDGTSVTTSAVVSGLTNGTQYVFRVAAVSGIGQGAWSAVPAAGDPYWSSVSLLLHMDGSGSTFVDSSATPKTITAVGGATQSTAQSKWGGKSFSLDGSTANLSLSSTGFDLSGDFVIEGWVYLTSVNAYATLLDARSAPAYQDFICGIYNVGGTLRPDFVTAGEAPGRLTGTSTSVSLNTWTHIAFVRSSGVISAYVNGTRDAAQVNYATPITPASSTILVGRNVDGNFVNGFIDDLRVTAGSSRGYTGSTITVPPAAFPDGPSPGVTPSASDQFFSNVALLLHMDGSGTSFTDSSSSPKSVSTAGTVTQSNSAAKWGSSGGSFSGGRLTIPGLEVGNNDFAIEGWFYLPTTPSEGAFSMLFSHRYDSTSRGGASLALSGSSLLYYLGGTSNTWQVEGGATGLSVTGGQWMHIALARSGTQCRAYLNGVGGTPCSVSGTIGTQLDFAIMSGSTLGGSPTVGYCDDFRVTLGTARGYTGATISVPGGPFPDA